MHEQRFTVHCSVQDETPGSPAGGSPSSGARGDSGRSHSSVGLVSFIVPAHNERESLPTLLEEIRACAADLESGYEIVVVDDGSTDGTREWLITQAHAATDLRVVHFPSNRGQSAALAAGLNASRGERLVTLDADLQSDPKDVPILLKALEVVDLACGVRAGRKDSLAKRVGSRVANRVRRWALGDRFADVGCTLKAWRRPVAEQLPRFDGFHRFLPVLAEAQGFRVSEVPVSHRSRLYGRTHYGNLGRARRGLVDLFGVAWLLRRWVDTSPEAETTPAGREGHDG